MEEREKNKNADVQNNKMLVYEQMSKTQSLRRSIRNDGTWKPNSRRAKGQAEVDT